MLDSVVRKGIGDPKKLVSPGGQNWDYTSSAHFQSAKKLCKASGRRDHGNSSILAFCTETVFRKFYLKGLIIFCFEVIHFE